MKQQVIMINIVSNIVQHIQHHSVNHTTSTSVLQKPVTSTQLANHGVNAAATSYQQLFTTANILQQPPAITSTYQQGGTVTTPTFHPSTL